MPKLVVISKSLPGLSFELSATPTIIGRAQGAAFQIIEPSVSGRHCEVRLAGNDVLVRDLKSTNGTFINGQQILEATLKSGQVLQSASWICALKLPRLRLPFFIRR